jgi:thiamine pyrophosphate-dependent acetolactate synthase large subunit-like protein
VCLLVSTPSYRVGILRRPLLVVGKGAALSQADVALRRLADATGLPFLATAMGRGVVPDDHPGAVNAARSAALRGADVALIFGARWDSAVISSHSKIGYTWYLAH